MAASGIRQWRQHEAFVQAASTSPSELLRYYQEHGLPSSAAAVDLPLAAMAVQASSLDLLRAVIAAGADVNYVLDGHRDALGFAVRSGQRRAIRLLLQAGAAADGPLGSASHLRVAAFAGDADVVLQLIASGADVNRASPAGVSPLMAAATAGRLSIVTALAACGADDGAAMKDGSTVWDAAAEGVSRALVMGRALAEGRQRCAAAVPTRAWFPGLSAQMEWDASP
eukprot:PLAT5271.1.p1 GENE.PLAT5271.1~~PLAT5271.1.p1  ORF type:complete len:255 (-),score=48.92 PLAT5271.1:105-782(-)